MDAQARFYSAKMESAFQWPNLRKNLERRRCQGRKGCRFGVILRPLVLHACSSENRVAPLEGGPQAAAPTIGESQWSSLDEIGLPEVFQTRFKVLQSCPVHLKVRCRFAMKVALEAVHTAVEQRYILTEVRGLKLFSLLPFCLLRKPPSQGRVWKSELSQRFEAFTRGHWGVLHLAGIRDASRSCAPETSGHRTPEQRTRAACQKVRFGEVLRARQRLTGACLTPKCEETFRELQVRRPQCQAQRVKQLLGRERRHKAKSQRR